MRGGIVTSAIILMTALSACGGGAGKEQLSVSQISDGSVDTSTLTPPAGAASAPVQVALERYRATCVNRSHPQEFGMVPVGATYIWYDPIYNMAVNDTRDDMCLFTFGTTDPAGTVVTSFSNANTPKFSRFEPTGSTYNGQSIYIAGEGK